MFGENFVATMLLLLLLLLMLLARDICVSPSGFGLQTSSGMLHHYDCSQLPTFRRSFLVQNLEAVTSKKMRHNYHFARFIF